MNPCQKLPASVGGDDVKEEVKEEPMVMMIAVIVGSLVALIILVCSLHAGNGVVATSRLCC